MRIEELEEWILRVAEQAKAKHPNEDSRVELKRIWIDPAKAARRLAAHANCARPSSILWVIGIDEKAGTILGADRKELATWWPQVQAAFSELSPDLLLSVVVPVDGKTLMGLLFDSSRAPFVVKNPSLSQGGRTAELEVPWRDGTLTRSARRQELIRLLVPREALPDAEVLQAELSAATEWRLKLILYLAPSDRPVVFPFHRIQASARFEGQDEGINFGGMRFVAPWLDADLPRAEITAADLTLTGASLARLEGSGLSEPQIPNAEFARIRVALQPARSDIPLIVEPPALGRTSTPALWLFHAPGSPIWEDLSQRHPLEVAADELDGIRDRWQLNLRRIPKLVALSAEIEHVLEDALSAVPVAVDLGIHNAVAALYDKVLDLHENLEGTGHSSGIRKRAYDVGIELLNRSAELRKYGKQLRESWTGSARR